MSPTVLQSYSGYALSSVFGGYHSRAFLIACYLSARKHLKYHALLNPPSERLSQISMEAFFSSIETSIYPEAGLRIPVEE